MKDAAGKFLKREHYTLLKDLGIEIVLYDLKSHADHTTTGMHQTEDGKVSYGFELYGSLTNDVDFDELHELLLMLRIARDSDQPAIIDALEHLKIVIGITADE